YEARLSSWLGIQSMPLWGLAGVTLLCLYIMDVYGIDTTDSRWRLCGKTVLAVVVASVIVTGLVYVAGTPRLQREPLFWRSVLPFGMLGFAVLAMISRLIIRYAVRKTERKRRWLVIGEGNRLSEFVKDFSQSPIDGRISVLDLNASGGTTSLHERVDVEDRDELVAVLNKRWTGIVVASNVPLRESLLELLMRVRLGGVDIHDTADFYERYWLKIPIHQIKDLWFVNSDGFRLIHHEISLNMKRLMDIVLALVGLVVLFPIMLLAGLLVVATDRGPVFYRQSRTGAGGLPIEIIKFRTMHVDAEKDGARWAAQDDPRVTRVGRLLRLMRVDELPQLWNVLRGEMSCIGPRPERPEFTKTLEQEIPYYDLRYLVKPGLTGWAQVMHPYGASTEDARRKLEYDLFYIKNHSMWLDILIALKTVRVILFGRGR
ncbi:MAG: sugar transferase, partial [Gammaproteobacteria bacterium]|nr:sugar transferase [Gammaproteobacteria bacterium]